MFHKKHMSGASREAFSSPKEPSVWKRKIKRGFEKFMALFDKHPYMTCFITAIIINSIIETASRHSLWAYLISIIRSPFVFIYSVIIIMLPLLLSLLFKKRFFVYFLISAVWLILGIVNGIVLLMRVTPLTGVDFLIVWSALGIIRIYLDLWQIIVIGICAALFIALLVYVAIKSPKSKVMLKRGILGIAVCAAAVAASTVLGIKAGVISDEFANLADAYKDYGFAYCFSRSVLDTGIPRPDEYEERIDEVSDFIDGGKRGTSPGAERPNVIVIQLESFFDPNQLTEYTYSKNPVPNFERLKKQCPSGYLTVPAVGAGTANTEFEVLTGMSLDFFGTCEYPYKTVLKNTPTESLCTNLSPYGYSTHAIHNNTGTFYDRHIVYPCLGFDTFTPLEYMTDVQYNSIGWAKDSILTGEIVKALDSTPGQDFVFTVSVQAHGKYPRDSKRRRISVSGGEDEALTNAVEYYVNEVSEVDRFIGELTERLSEYNEKVLLVMYGDHLPSLDITDETTKTGDVFKTEYVMWSNYDMEAEDCDLYAWQLSSHILDVLQLTGGPVSRLHSMRGENPDYLQDLEALEYDLLYGDFEIFDGVNPYKATDMQMGAEPVTVAYWVNSGTDLCIKGSNFTGFSHVYINGKEYDTIYVSSSTLMVADANMFKGDELSVAQLTSDGYELGQVVYIPKR